jgi:predicted transcriptional regulator
METSIKTAFNVVKEFITHIRNETSDKDLKAAIKQKYKKFETEGDVYISEFVAADVTIVERKLEDIEKTLSDEDDQPYEVHPAAPRCLQKLADMGRTMHPDARLRRGSQTIRRRPRRCYSRQGLARDRNQRCKGYRCRYGHSVRNCKPFRNSTCPSPKTSANINIEELMKNGMDPSSSTMQDMSNVSKDIQTRIDNGEVDQEQLMKEATDLLSSLGGEGGSRWMMEMMVVAVAAV